MGRHDRHEITIGIQAIPVAGIVCFARENALNILILERQDLQPICEGEKNSYILFAI